MSSSIRYSVIIPHKNIPELLIRCLNSIPKREDLEVIIVDDNSDTDRVDFTLFPGLNRKRTTVIFTKEGKGAGYARNVGLNHAKGDWILFSDADDFFTPELEKYLDEYGSSDAEIIFFKHKNVLSSDINIEENRWPVINYVMTSDMTMVEKESFFRYRHIVPWGKLIKRELIQRENIRFEEIKYANDIMFAVRAGCSAKKVVLADEFLYVLTEREGSLSSGNCKTTEELLARASAHIRMQAYIEKHGYHKEKPAMWFLPAIFRRSQRAFLSALKDCFRNELSMKDLFKEMVHTTRKRSRPALILLFMISFIQNRLLPQRPETRLNPNTN